MENANVYHTEGSNHEKKGRESSVTTEEKSNYRNWRDWRHAPNHNTEKSSSSTRLPLYGRDDSLNTLGFEPTTGDLHYTSCRLCHRESSCGSDSICLSSPTNYITNSNVEATARSKPKTERDVGGTKHSVRKCRYKNDVPIVGKMEVPHQVGNIEATVRVTDHSGLLSISDLQLSIGFHEGSKEKPHTRYNTGGDIPGPTVQQDIAHDSPISLAKRECCERKPLQKIAATKLSNFKDSPSPRLSTDADCIDGNGKRDSVKCVSIEHEVLVRDSKHKSQSSGIGLEKYDDGDDYDVRNLLHRSLELQTYIRIRQEETSSYNKGQYLTHQKSGTHSLISKEEKLPNSRYQLKSTDHIKGHSNLLSASIHKAGHDLVIGDHRPLRPGTGRDLTGGEYRSQSVGGSFDLSNEFRSLPQTHSSKPLLKLSVHSTAPGSEENQLLSNGNDPILSRHNQVLSDWKDPMLIRDNHLLSNGKEPLLIRDNRVLSNEKDHITSSGRSSGYMQRKESVFPPRESDKLSQSRPISQSSNSSYNMDRDSLTSRLTSTSRETTPNTGPPPVRSQGSRVGKEDAGIPCANGGLTDSAGSERPEEQLNMSYGSDYGSLNLTLPQPETLPVFVVTEQGFPKVPIMPVSISDNADISSVISQDCQDSQDFSLRTEMLISHLKLANEILDEFAAETKALVNLTRGAHVLDDRDPEEFKSGLVADKEVVPGCEIGNMDRVSAWLNEGLKKRDQTLPSRTSPPSSPNLLCTSMGRWKSRLQSGHRRQNTRNREPQSDKSSGSCAGEGRNILESAEDVRVKYPQSDTHTRKTRPWLPLSTIVPTPLTREQPPGVQVPHYIQMSPSSTIDSGFHGLTTSALLDSDDCVSESLSTDGRSTTSWADSAITVTTHTTDRENVTSLTAALDCPNRLGDRSSEGKSLNTKSASSDHATALEKSHMLELKKKAFQVWQDYCDEQRHLQELTYLTREATSKRLMTSSWARWRHRLNDVREGTNKPTPHASVSVAGGALSKDDLYLFKTEESNTASTITCEVRPIHHHNMIRQSILEKGSGKAYHCNDKSVSGSGRNTHSIRTRIPQLTTRGVRDDTGCNSRKLSLTRSTSIFRDSDKKLNLALHTPIPSLAAAYSDQIRPQSSWPSRQVTEKYAQRWIIHTAEGVLARQTYDLNLLKTAWVRWRLQLVKRRTVNQLIDRFERLHTSRYFREWRKLVEKK